MWVRSLVWGDPWSRKWQKLKYSCLENSRYRGAWQATVHGATKNGTQLSTVILCMIFVWWVYNFTQPPLETSFSFSTCGDLKHKSHHTVCPIWSQECFALKKKIISYFFNCNMPHVESQLPDQGSNSYLLHWKHRILNTVPPGKS